MNCIEQNFGIITGIEAFDLDKMSPAQNVYFPKRFFSSTEQMTVTEVVIVPMYPKSAKLSETSLKARGGKGYEVSLSWQVHRPTNEEFGVLEYLNNVKCLKITAFGGSAAYILCEDGHYQYSYQRNGEMIDCSIRICNINGIQQVV